MGKYGIMKVPNRKSGKTGVSPVIATILLVAITVVLAATLYISIGNMTSQTSTNLLAGSLTYSEELSDPAHGNATFTLTLNTPGRCLVDDLGLKILDKKGNLVNSADITEIVHIASDDNHVKGGDHIVIEYPNHDIHRYQVILYIRGYQGTIEGDVPS